jgi:hypothetical protein
MVEIRPRVGASANSPQNAAGTGAVGAEPGGRQAGGHRRGGPAAGTPSELWERGLAKDRRPLRPQAAHHLSIRTCRRLLRGGAVRGDLADDVDVVLDHHRHPQQRASLTSPQALERGVTSPERSNLPSRATPANASS